jgi:hypothetical protein
MISKCYLLSSRATSTACNVEIRPWMRLTGGKVQIFDRAFEDGRWYRCLPVSLRANFTEGVQEFDR